MKLVNQNKETKKIVCGYDSDRPIPQYKSVAPGDIIELSGDLAQYAVKMGFAEVVEPVKIKPKKVKSYRKSRSGGKR